MNPQILKEYSKIFEIEHNNIKQNVNKINDLDQETIDICDNLLKNVDDIYNNVVNFGTHYVIHTHNKAKNEDNDEISFTALDFFKRDENLKNNLQNLSRNKSAHFESENETKDISVISPNENKDIFKKQYDLYISALKNINVLEERLNSKKDNNIQENVEENKYKKALKDYIDFVKPILNEDVMGFNAIKPENCKTLDNMYSFAKKAVYDTSKTDKKKYGANQSSRFKMTFKFYDGNESTGFFTENTKYDPVKEMSDAKKKYEKIYKNTSVYKNFYSKVFDAAKNHPVSNAEILEKVISDNKLNPQQANQLKAEKSYSFPNPRYYSAICKLSDNIEYNSYTGKYECSLKSYGAIENALKIFRQNDENNRTKNPLADYVFSIVNSKDSDDKQGFYGSLFAFTKTFRSTITSCGINQSNLLMSKGADIGYRNCAMSAVDKLIGTNVLANSHKVTTYENDKKIEGIFMEEAKGTDFTGLKADDPRYLVRMDNASNPELLKSISDMQILDYICGNVDRHGSNYFYKFDKKNENIIGLIGIDNDSSFTKKVPNLNQQLNRLPSLINLKVIKESTANRLMELTKDDLTVVLKPYGLDNEEIDAAYKRLANLQDAIGSDEQHRKYFSFDKNAGVKDNKFHLTILKDKDWENVNIDSLRVINFENPNDKSTNIYNFVFDRLVDINANRYVRDIDSTMSHQNLAILRTNISLTKSCFKDLDNKLKNESEFKEIHDSVKTSLKKKLNITTSEFDPIKNKNSKTYNNYLLALNDLKEKAQNYLNNHKNVDKNNKEDVAKIELVNHIIDKVNYFTDSSNELFEGYRKDTAKFIKQEEQAENFGNIRNGALKKRRRRNKQNNIINLEETLENEDDEQIIPVKPNFLDDNISEVVDLVEKIPEKINNQPKVNQNKNIININPKVKNEIKINSVLDNNANKSKINIPNKDIVNDENIQVNNTKLEEPVINVNDSKNKNTNAENRPFNEQSFFGENEVPVTGPFNDNDNPQKQSNNLNGNSLAENQIKIDKSNVLDIGIKQEAIQDENNVQIKQKSSEIPEHFAQNEPKLDNQINNNIDVQKLKENPNLTNKLNESLFKGNNQAYEALVQNRKIVNEPYFKEEDLVEDRDDFAHELFENDYHFFNANGPLTREQAIYCYNHDKTFGVLRDDSASLIRNSKEGVYEHSLDRRSTYRKMANRLEEGKRWYNSSSPEYAAMSEILNSLAKDDDVLEPFCLGELRDNINKYKKNYGNKKASGEPSDIAKLRYNLVREIESELREIEKDRAVEHHFDDARGFAEFQKEFPEYEYNIDTDVENSFEPEDINVYEDQKFDLKEFLKSGKGTYHDYLANGAKLAAQDPRNKPFYEYLLDAAKEVAGGEEQSEATDHFEKSIKNGKADKLTNKDYAALEADRQKKKGDGIMDEVGKFSMYWNVLKLVTLIMAGTGPLGIAAAFLKSFMWSSGLKIGWSLFNKVKDTVKKYKDDKKAAKEYSYALRHGKTDDAKEIRKKQIERVIKRQKEHQMALRNKQNGLKKEQKAEKVANPEIEKQVVENKGKIEPEKRKAINIVQSAPVEEAADNLQKDKNDGNKLRKHQTFSENPFKEKNNIKDNKNKLAHSDGDIIEFNQRKTK